MPNTRLHDVKEGETLQDLSARYYGLPSEYQRIVNANPEVATNFYEIFPGQLLVIPEKESLNTSGTTIETGDDDVVIGIDGVIYSNFTGFSLKRSIKDAADVFAFEIPWNNPTAAQKKTFMPFSYNFVQIFIGSVLRFTGTLINVLYNVYT